MTGLAQYAQLFKAGEAVCHFLTRTDCPPAPAGGAEGTQPAGPLPGSPSARGQAGAVSSRPSVFASGTQRRTQSPEDPAWQ